MAKSSFKVTIDPRLLQAELSAGKNGAAVAREIRSVIAPDIEKKQMQLVKEFAQHPVSQEIAEGPRASNKSGTLSGYGNLFSFLGFDNGENPLAVIEEILSKKLKYRVRSLRNGKFAITIDIPKPEDIFGATPMPWAGSLSWAGSIEAGVSNAAAYLFNPSGFPNSASGTGLQSRNSVSGVSFKRTPYITSLIEGFKKDLSKL